MVKVGWAANENVLCLAREGEWGGRKEDGRREGGEGRHVKKIMPFETSLA